MFTPKKVPTKDLFFDEKNPRLETGNSYSTETDVNVISALKVISDLNEIIGSICENTYIDLEPLIVMPRKEGYTVIEGNRRLAAIKLIKNPKLADDCKIILPSNIQKKVHDSLVEISVVEVGNRSEAQAFIAFKHINGPYRWDSYAKAKFVTEWYKNEAKKGTTVDDIARQIGDENNTIRAFIASMLVLEQAENEGLFEIKDRYNRGRFAFSHLYTALDRKEYMSFLDLEKDWNKEPNTKPIKKEKLDALKEVLLYLYGSKKDDEKPKIVSQNPDLKRLGEVIVNKIALAKIRLPKSELNLAYQEIRPGNEVLTEALVIVHSKLKESLSIIDKYKGEPYLYDLGCQILDQAQTLVDVMKRKKTDK